MKRVLLISVALLAASTPVRAQSPMTAGTLKLDEGATRAAATIEDVAWIAGHWHGEAFGGLSEEIWSPPLAGAMMGVYRSIENGAVRFYEILQIIPEDGSLSLRLKHFDSMLRGWEEKDEVRAFPLVKIETGVAWFEGMTFRRDGPDAIVVLLAIEHADRAPEEVEFRYQRVDH